MAKKTYSVTARVVRAARWVIDYTVTDHSTGISSRHRRDFGLNRVRSVNDRDIIAAHIVDYIEEFIQEKPVPTTKSEIKERIDLCGAVHEAFLAKSLKGRKDTVKSYRTVLRTFNEFAKTIQIDDLSAFQKKHAVKYFDWLHQRRAYSNTTINNHLTMLKSLWSELENRNEGVKNVWKDIKPLRQMTKKRRKFSDSERIVVANYLAESDYFLFRYILLEYYCYIRPLEITRLRFCDFDLGAGTVTIQSESAKSWKKRVVTIPDIARPFFADGIFDVYHGSLFVFGPRLMPGKSPVNTNTVYKRHQMMLKKLLEMRKLSDISGLSLYSWKDTGITDNIKKTSPVSTRDQAGHHDLEITMKYYHKDQVNIEYKSLTNHILK